MRTVEKYDLWAANAHLIHRQRRRSWRRWWRYIVPRLDLGDWGESWLP